VTLEINQCQANAAQKETILKCFFESPPCKWAAGNASQAWFSTFSFFFVFCQLLLFSFSFVTLLFYVSTTAAHLLPLNPTFSVQQSRRQVLLS
jgi:hypothetical protein